MAGTNETYDVIIIGGGPAGLTAGIYTARGKLNTLLLEKMATGGQAATTHNIENYPGFPDGITGPELADRMTAQAENLGLQIQYRQVTGVEKKETNFVVNCDDGESYLAKAVIIAAGAEPRRLGVKGEKEMIGAGVCYCATCDGAFYQDKEIAVVGGGDSALEEALYLTRFAEKVTLIHRRDSFRAARVLNERVFAHHKIAVEWNNVVKEIVGQNRVERIILGNVVSGEQKSLKVDGVFVAVGLTPNTQFLGDLVEKTPEGYIITNNRLETSCPGVFAAGDINLKDLRQVVTAASDGACSGQFVQEWLSKNNFS